ncbi:hypothetical protein T4B_11834 [Trichinella pseudospiralis]|uniref:Uncharacterized protein n=1 Tax=Trichinella pseudospiralis TaxID=6337 RepID=A0A0V1GIF1_TRIPS|nr:hypothetical protein T4B_11834 [Trichinella pseudospiralis]
MSNHQSRQAKSEKHFDANIQQSPLPGLAENCSCGQFITCRLSHSSIIAFS